MATFFLNTDATDATEVKLILTVAARRAAVLTAGVRASLEPTRAYCGDCRGTGRKDGACQRCRGRGFTTVGRTKR